MEKRYAPNDLQTKWNRRWEESCFFEAKTDAKPTFTIFMPPPNVTGILHMGHVLNNTIQDVLCRWARLQGKNVLWLPGTDHAGIATQNKVEKVLKEEKGLTRHQLGREAFLQKVEEWRQQHGQVIFEQLKTLGVSCDWSRATYTLDPDYSRRVQSVFVKLYERGYIYKGKRLVHWCPVSQTALSDEEVIMKPTKGVLCTFRYEVIEKPQTFLSIATTRPETIMGDVALAVHPKDPRYASLVGLHARCPFDPQRTIPIIADSAVEMDFGTGALKITPAHDPIDFEVGKRHQLPLIEVLDAAGKINANGAPFTGMDRMEARKAVIEALREKGLLVKEEPYEHAVGYSERANVPIEPRLSEQWFLRYPKVEEAKQLLEKNLVRFYPAHWEKIYRYWLDHIQDWCISRQLWWGHRIPVWYRKDHPSDYRVSVEAPSDRENWEQDPDVLDTWFSSWLWPMGTLHFQENSDKNLFNRYFPSQVLVSGSDILFFWITRMILASLELVEDRSVDQRVPFHDIYLTGIVRDAKGRKMSKSLGNSPDPLDLIQAYGADGVRIGMLSIAPKGHDICFDEHALVAGRNFCTKLWNACRFRQMQGRVGEYSSFENYWKGISSASLSSIDQYLLHSLVLMMKTYEKHLSQYELNAAIKELQAGFRNLFCDFYLEIQKYQPSGSFVVQDLFVRQILIMLHPYAPYITEELWEQMHAGSGTLQEARWELPELSSKVQTLALSLKELETMENIRTLVDQLRTFIADHSRTSILHVLLESKERTEFETYQSLLAQLLKISSFQVVSKPLSGAAQMVTHYGIFFIQEEGTQPNLDRTQQEQQMAELKQYIQTAEQKLSNEKFLSHAPATVIAGVQKQLEENRKKLEIAEQINEKIKNNTVLRGIQPPLARYDERGPHEYRYKRDNQPNFKRISFEEPLNELFIKLSPLIKAEVPNDQREIVRESINAIDPKVNKVFLQKFQEIDFDKKPDQNTKFDSSLYNLLSQAENLVKKQGAPEYVVNKPVFLAPVTFASRLVQSKSLREEYMVFCFGRKPNKDILSPQEEFLSRRFDCQFVCMPTVFFKNAGFFSKNIDGKSNEGYYALYFPREAVCLVLPKGEDHISTECEFSQQADGKLTLWGRAAFDFEMVYPEWVIRIALPAEIKEL